MMWFTSPLFCDAGEWEKSKYKQQHQQKQDEASLESRQLLPFLWGDKQRTRADTHNNKSSVSTFSTLRDALYPGLLKTIQHCLIPPWISRHGRVWRTSCLSYPVRTQHVRVFTWWITPSSCSKIKTQSDWNQQLRGRRQTDRLSGDRRQTGGPLEALVQALINAHATLWNGWEINRQLWWNTQGMLSLNWEHNLIIGRPHWMAGRII